MVDLARLQTGFAAPDALGLAAETMGWHETLPRAGAPTMTNLPGSMPYHPLMATIETERAP